MRACIWRAAKSSFDGSQLAVPLVEFIWLLRRCRSTSVQQHRHADHADYKGTFDVDPENCQFPSTSALHDSKVLMLVSMLV